MLGVKQMTERLTPEERLRKYKEFLAGLEAEARGGQSPSSATASNVKDSQVSAPRIQKELVDALAVLAEKQNEREASDTKEQSAKEKVLLKVKARAIQSSMKEIREERQLLRRKVDRGQISTEEYERKIHELVRRGKKLLEEQAANGVPNIRA